MTPYHTEINPFMDAQESVRRWVGCRMPGSDFADDIVQAVWIETILHFPHVVNPKAYFFIAARNEVWRHIRQVCRLNEVSLDALGPPHVHYNGQNSDLGIELLQRVHVLVSTTCDEVMLGLAIEVMSKQERDIFAMRAEGMRYRQISTLTGRSEASLRKLVHRCRGDLPRRWDKRARTLVGMRVDPLTIYQVRRKRRVRQRVFRLF
jgi:RNA polymerase sigma factor (sigma-70 family)